MGKVSKGFAENFARERMAEFVAKGKWTLFSAGWPPNAELGCYVRLKDGRVFLAEYYRPGKGGWSLDELNTGPLLDWTPRHETWNSGGQRVPAHSV